MQQKANLSIRISLGILAVILLLITAKYVHIREFLKYSLDWISRLGFLGPIIFIFIYILACILFLPGSILTLGAGIIFGVFWGCIYVSISATLGATAAFLVGRFIARDWVAKRISGNDKFKAIDEAVGREGWKIVLLTRLSPIFPFNLLNYAFGLTRVTLKEYFFASWIGMLPGTIMYVYIGSLAGSLVTLDSANRTRTTGEWVLYIIGLLATLAVTLYITKIARKALEKKVS